MTVTSNALAGLLTRCKHELHGTLAMAPTATPRSAPGVRWFRGGLPYAAFNRVIETNLTTDSSHDAIRQIVEDARTHHTPLTWITGPDDTPGDLDIRLLDAGWRHVEDEPGMVCDLRVSREVCSPPAPLRFVDIRTDADMRTWAGVWAYDAPAELHDRVGGYYASLELDETKPLQHVLGLLDDRPVVCATLFRGSEAAAVEHVVTLPEARRRGLGAAITSELMTRARAHGYDWAVLTASPLGEGTYRRLGFGEVCTVRTFEWRP